MDAHTKKTMTVDWFDCGMRLPSLENNRRQLIACGQASKGSRVSRGSLRGITAGHKRREQAVPPALVWVASARRSEIEEAAGPFD